MKIQDYFLNAPLVDVTAAHIGINKWDWEYSEKRDINHAKSIMKSNRYDVLPIVNSNNEIEQYYSTTEWNNYSTIDLKEIDNSCCVYYRLSIEDLISKMHLENRNYYFLINHSTVVGLVSLVNFSCQSAYNFFFQTISNTERKLSMLLKTELDELEVISTLRKSTDKINQDLVKQYDTAVNNGVDASIFEMTYLNTLGYLISKFKDSLDSYEQLEPYTKYLLSSGLFSIVRNTIMHPVKGIINEDVNISNLYEFITENTRLNALLDDIEPSNNTP
ncbi:MAG: hypothetical protein ABJK11_14815 [Balneola sp.]